MLNFDFFFVVFSFFVLGFFLFLAKGENLYGMKKIVPLIVRISSDGSSLALNTPGMDRLYL